jgi:two-component system LytT family response regulator
VTLRVIIADDEPLARARMRRLLADEAELEIVAECANGAEAVDAIRTLRPDVVFLDIEMPELDGFEVLMETSARAVVFVTAYDAHAIRAFEAHALDYVLKPVEAERLHRSVERARASVAANPPQRASLERLIVRTRGRISFIDVRELTHIEAAGNYARLHTSREHPLIRHTLSDLEAKLDPRRFVRIHRSTIVNIAAVREIRPWFRGDSLVVLADGTELALSRTYRERATAAFATGVTT